MRSTLRNSGIILSCSFLALLCGCGGGGGSTDNRLSVNHAPVATAPAVTSTDSPLVQYRTYTFTTTATDPDFGDSVASCVWDFGDGSGPQTPVTTPPFTATHVFQVPSPGDPGVWAVSVTPTDSHGLAGKPATSEFTVLAAPNPFVVALTGQPSSATSLPIPLGGASSVPFLFTVAYTGAGTVATSGVTLTPGAPATANATVTGVVGADTHGVANWTATVRFPASAHIGDIYTATPTLTVSDSFGVQSVIRTYDPITFVTVPATSTPPSVVIATPAAISTNIYALQTATLDFVVTDLGTYPTVVEVNWGEAGSTNTTFTLSGTGLATGLHPPTPCTHQYLTTGTHTVTVTATDSQQTNNQAVPQNRDFVVLANALPTATIITPQASGALPADTTKVNTFTPSTMSAEMSIPVAAKYPQIVVIPNNGRLAFNGTATLSTSGEALKEIRWTFPGGSPGESAALNAGNVSFAGEPGKIVAYLVELQAVDVFGRNSSQVGNGLTGDPASAVAGQNTTPFRKWVIVDGTQTQSFYLNFLYRQKTDVAMAPIALAPVISAANGLGAPVQIFQDGVSNTYAVQSGLEASVIIPVRSNLPFWISIPTFGTDTLGYVMEIPNAPTGQYMDPSLVAAGTLPPPTAGSFSFANDTAPFNPTLNLVTGQGYATEGQKPAMVNFQGHSTLQGNDSSAPPKTDRWFNLLSVPFTDATATQFEVDNALFNAFAGIKAFQSFPEWLLYVKTMESDLLTYPLITLPPSPPPPAGVAETPVDINSTGEGKPADLGFKVDTATYAQPTAKSATFAAVGLQAFRVPAGQVDPYNLSNGPANWNAASCSVDLVPKQIGAATGVPAFYRTMIYGGPGATPLSGGLDSITIPYDVNYPDRPLLPTPLTRRQSQGNPVFSEAEYLWSSVWVRPQVLNTTLLSETDTYFFMDTYPWYRYSSTTTWPAFTETSSARYAITPDNSYFDLNVHGGPAFNAGYPVYFKSDTSTHNPNAVGRFWWTAFNPRYNAPDGACIARTWLSDDSTSLVPLTFTGSASTDANNALGLLPPVDPVVDKRGRDAKGQVLPGGVLGGYRITWFNPTKAADQKTCVAPDFWAVELSANGNVTHFLLPASFPAAPTDLSPDNTQTSSAQLLTDLRYFLPSGNAPTAGADAADTMAPGYCWFDVPPELRPAAGSNASIIVFALKSITANNAPAGAFPRPLNRTDWIDAIKTATATISIQPNIGKDLGYVYKVPFNYGWDIVVANCEATPVAP